MAERPSLHIGVAGQKNKASYYNDNFDMMMDYVEECMQESKDYVDDNVDNKANLTLSNVTSLSDAVKTLLGNEYAKKDLTNISGSISGTMTSTDKANILDWMMPNLTGRISVSLPYTAPSAGWFYTGRINASKWEAHTYIDGVDVWQSEGDEWVVDSSYFPVHKGGRITGTYGGGAFFAPCKGV